MITPKRGSYVTLERMHRYARAADVKLDQVIDGVSRKFSEAGATLNLVKFLSGKSQENNSLAWVRGTGCVEWAPFLALVEDGYEELQPEQVVGNRGELLSYLGETKTAQSSKWPSMAVPDQELNDLTSMLAEARVVQRNAASVADKACLAHAALAWASEYLNEDGQALVFGGEGMEFKSYPRSAGHREFILYLQKAIAEALPQLLTRARHKIDSDLWAARCLVEQSKLEAEVITCSVQAEEPRFASGDYVARTDILDYAKEHGLDPEKVHNQVVEVLLGQARLLTGGKHVTWDCGFAGYTGGNPHWEAIVLYAGDNNPGVNWHWGGPGRCLSVEEVLQAEKPKDRSALAINPGDYVTREAIKNYAHGLEGAVSEEEVHNDVLQRLRDRCRELGTCTNHGGEFGDHAKGVPNWDAVAILDEGEGYYEVSWVFVAGMDPENEIDIDDLMGAS